MSKNFLHQHNKKVFSHLKKITDNKVVTPSVTERITIDYSAERRALEKQDQEQLALKLKQEKALKDNETQRLIQEAATKAIIVQEQLRQEKEKAALKAEQEKIAKKNIALKEEQERMIKDAESLKERQQNIAKIEEAIELEREKILKEQEIQKEERAQLAREKIFIEKEKATAVIDMQEMINELNLEDEEVLEQEKEKINTPPIIYAEEMLSDSEDDYCIVSLTGDT